MLKLWLPFIDGLKQQGISNTTVENMGGVSTAAAGKIGACMSFTGTANSYLRLSPILDANSDCTIAFWVKFNNVSTNQCIFSQRVEAQANGYTIFLLGTGIRFDEGAQATYGTVAANTWYHIVCCKDASKKYIYINGALVGSTTRTTQSAAKVNTNYALIGGSQNTITGTPSQGTTNALNGYLNDFRIYDNCLSAAEVKELAQGLVLHYKLNGGLFGNPNLVLGSGTTATSTNKWTGHSATGGNTSTFEYDNDTPCVRVVRDNVAQTSWDYLSYDRLLQSQIKTNTTYTVTFDCKPDVDGSIGFTGFVNGNATNYLTASTTNVQSSCYANKWNHMVYKCVTKSSFDGLTIGGQVVYFTRSATLRAVNVSVLFKNIKVEEGDAETPWCPADSELDIDRTVIKDSSGYNHNGTIVGSVVSTADTVRYDASMHINGAGVITTVSPGADIRTLSCWVKTTKNKSTSQMLVADSGSNICISFYSGTIIGVFGTTRSTGSKCTLGASYKENDWNHIVVVKTSDDGKRDIYCNGEKLTPAADDYWSATAGFFVGNRNGTVGGNTPFYGYISDVRAYCTPLLDTDIKQLYNVGMKIDKSHNIHTYELHQEDKNKLHKTGVLSNSNFNEINNLFNLLYDKQLYIEPDGSCWIRIFHHANCDTKLFTSSDTFTTSVYKDADRWFNISLCNKVNKWELMVKSMPTAGGTETKYRWIQTKNPMTAAYADVAAANVTKVTGNGYASYGWGGLYHIGSNTYLSTNNGTSGNWWGAVGAWAYHQGGIPGWTTVITTGYEDVYLRIDNLDQVNLHAKNIKAGMWTANQFIEK